MNPELLQQAPPELHQTLSHYWEDWQLACEKQAMHPAEGFDLAVLGKVWACSDFAAQTSIRRPDVLRALLQEGIEINRALADYRQLIDVALAGAQQNDNSVMQALRQLRQKEMLRIAWRDLTHCAETTQVLYELSDLAEAFVAQTLQYVERDAVRIFGQPVDAANKPQSLLVLAMGKMGGRELNFSSDIDLILAYAEEGETPGPRRTSHHEFFIWEAKKLIRYLHEITADGFVYRVDTRLRPNGASGPLVMSFAGMEQYYQLQGRNWERYAMVKARIISGDPAHRQVLQALLTPFVFRRYLDYSAFESIREMKAMIAAQMKRKGMRNNVKLGRGGIREIEFIGQTFQLLRGGREPELRVRRIVVVLQLLAEKHYLEESEAAGLIEAYDFLRRLENRLQMQKDQQTHSLPDDEQLQARLCLSMGLAMGLADWPTLLQQLDQHRDFVDRIFAQLIEPAEQPGADSEVECCDETEVAQALAAFWTDADNTELLAAWLSRTGYGNVDAVVTQLTHFQQSSRIRNLAADSQRRLLQLLSSLLGAARTYDRTEDLLRRVLDILQAIAGRSVYISMLNEYPKLRAQLLRLCSAGDWFSENLARYPLLLDSLLNADELFSLEQSLDAQLDGQLKRIGQEHADNLMEEQMDRLRQFKRQHVFRIAILDVFYELPVETVGDQLSAIAEAVLKQVLQLAWDAMAARYGEPQCIIDGRQHQPGLSIIGYGKLGGYELGYGSDLDIIFLHNSAGEQQQTSGEAGIDNLNFFARVAQRVIHLLGTRTYAGILYEVDTRLRPDGQAGLLVSSLSAFESYQHEKAWTWEHQALIRARFITGNAQVEQEFDRIRCAVLSQTREKRELLAEVVRMREKMRTHLANRASGFDVKQDAGGLVDIEFMTQAGVLLHAADMPACLEQTATLALIKALVDTGWYEAGEAKVLAAAYRYFRQLKNWQDLQYDAGEADIEAHRDRVIELWQRLMPTVTADEDG